MSCKSSHWFETFERVGRGDGWRGRRWFEGRAGSHQRDVDLVARSYRSQVNGLTCPPEGIPRYSRLNPSSPSARRSCSRNSGENVSISSAVAFSRIQDCSSPAQAVQNGSVRSMPSTTWQSAPVGGGPASGATRRSDHRVVGPLRPPRSSHPLSGRGPNRHCSGARGRVIRSLARARRRCRFQARRPPVMRASRTRRTASALCRCAGQAITDNDPEVKTMKCAIAQAAVVVLPTCRAVSARIDAPRGARRNCSCHAVGLIPKTSRTHRAGSSR